MFWGFYFQISELKHQIEDLQSRNENSPKEAAASEKSNSNPTLRRLVQERKEAHDVGIQLIYKLHFFLHEIYKLNFFL